MATFREPAQCTRAVSKVFGLCFTNLYKNLRRPSSPKSWYFKLFNCLKSRSWSWNLCSSLQVSFSYILVFMKKLERFTAAITHWWSVLGPTFPAGVPPFLAGVPHDTRKTICVKTETFEALYEDDVSVLLNAAASFRLHDKLAVSKRGSKPQFCWR